MRTKWWSTRTSKLLLNADNVHLLYIEVVLILILGIFSKNHEIMAKGRLADVIYIQFSKVFGKRFSKNVGQIVANFNIRFFGSNGESMPAIR